MPHVTSYGIASWSYIYTRTYNFRSGIILLQCVCTNVSCKYSSWSKNPVQYRQRIVKKTTLLCCHRSWPYSTFPRSANTPITATSLSVHLSIHSVWQVEALPVLASRGMGGMELNSMPRIFLSGPKSLFLTNCFSNILSACNNNDFFLLGSDPIPPWPGKALV